MAEDGTLTEEDVIALLESGEILPGRKPVPGHAPTGKFMDSLKFKDDIEKYPAAKLGLKEAGTVWNLPTNTNVPGAYTKDANTKQALKDQVDPDKRVGMASRYLRDEVGVRDPESRRRAIKLTNEALPDGEISKTGIVKHEGRHSAFESLSEDAFDSVIPDSLKFKKMSKEETMMRVMDYMLEAPDSVAVKSIQSYEGLEDFLKEKERDPEVLRAVIEIQRAAAERLQEEYGESTPIHFPPKEK